jgi:hypothetical protein
MTPEDEEFERISREIRRNAAEDDDIQDYKKPWVGLTDEEVMVLNRQSYDAQIGLLPLTFYRAIERKLKEKNF